MITARLVYDLPIEVQWPDGRTLHCRSHDIDQNGITIKSPLTAAKGQQFKLAFKLLIGYTPHLITCRAEVSLVYLAGEDDLFHIRLLFRELNLNQKRLIETFIRDRKPV